MGYSKDIVWKLAKNPFYEYLNIDFWDPIKRKNHYTIEIMLVQ